MKFLGISKLKDAALALPPAVIRQLMEGTLAVISQQKKEGKILEYYFAPAWDRAIVITEAKTAEEMLKNISAMPIASYLNMEAYPLADGIEAGKALIETLKAAEKMMPGAPR
jgi:hypothetical protein